MCIIVYVYIYISLSPWFLISFPSIPYHSIYFHINLSCKYFGSVRGTSGGFRDQQLKVSPSPSPSPVEQGVVHVFSHHQTIGHRIPNKYHGFVPRWCSKFANNMDIHGSSRLQAWSDGKAHGVYKYSWLVVSTPLTNMSSSVGAIIPN